MPGPTTQPTEVAAPRRSRRLVARTLLGAWLLAVVTAFLAINLGIADPAAEDTTFTGLWPVDHPYWFNPLIALIALVPAAVLGVSVGRAFGLRTRPGSAAAAFAAGIIAWSLGNLVWFWYNTCTAWGPLGCTTAIEAPYPSAADVGFIALLPCYAFAMVQLSRMLATTWRDVLRLAWIPVLAFAGTAFLMAPDFTALGVHVPARSLLFDEGYTTTQSSFSVLYIVSDALLLSLAIINLVRARQAAGGIFFRGVLLTAVAVLLLYVGDVIFDVRVANETAFAGDIADFTYFSALFVMVLGIYVLGRAHERLTARVAAMAAAMSLEPATPAGEPVTATNGGDAP